MAISTPITPPPIIANVSGTLSISSKLVESSAKLLPLIIVSRFFEPVAIIMYLACNSSSLTVIVSLPVNLPNPLYTSIPALLSKKDIPFLNSLITASFLTLALEKSKVKLALIPKFSLFLS